MAINYTKLTDEIKQLVNYHKFPSGKDNFGQSIKVLNPEDFIAKYPSVFDDKTDAARLPKTSEGITALLMTKLAGANPALTATKIASKGMFDNSDIEQSFDVQKYISVTKDKDDDGETVEIEWLLQDPKQFYAFTKDLLNFTKQQMDTLVSEREEFIRTEFQNKLDNVVSELESQTQSSLQEAINNLKIETPALLRQTNQQSLATKVFHDYGVKILENNGNNNQVNQYLSDLNVTDPNTVTELYKQWEQDTLTRFNSWLSQDSNRIYQPEIVALFTRNALQELLMNRGFYLNEPLPSFNQANSSAPVTQSSNQNTVINSGTLPNNNVPNPFNPPRNALENQSGVPNISSPMKQFLQQAIQPQT